MPGPLSKKDYQFEQLSPDTIGAGIGVQRQLGVPPITATTHTLPFDRLSPRDLAAVLVAGRARGVRSRRAPGCSSSRDFVIALSW